MSSLSSEFSGSGEVSGTRTVPEKPSFSQTCSLLSRYLKEKGLLGDLNLGMSFDGKGMPMSAAQSTSTSNISTMNLFPTMGPNSSEFTGMSNRTPMLTREVMSMDLFPQHSGFGPSVSKDEVPSKADQSVSKPVPESSPMTIFYGGRVIVFDDISADMAKEITLLASKASYQDPNIFVPAPIRKPTETPNATGMKNSVNNLLIERLHSAIASDVPIARKASLTRFLEKRRDRISARAPYQKSNPKASPCKESKKPWLGLAPRSPPQQYEQHQS